MMELNKEYIARTLAEQKLWKEGEADTFRHNDWKITLRKGSKMYEPYVFFVYGEKENSCETKTRRYTSMEKAFLHILNNFNENASIKNKYVILEDYIN